MRGTWSSSGDLGEKDCLWRGSSLPAWWLLLSSRAFNGRTVPLTVCLEGTPHFFYISVYRSKLLIKDKSILFMLNMRKVWLSVCCLSFNWYLHLGYFFSAAAAAAAKWMLLLFYVCPCPFVQSAGSNMRSCSQVLLQSWMYSCLKHITYNLKTQLTENSF